MHSRLGLYRGVLIVGLLALVMGAVAATSGANRQMSSASHGGNHTVECKTCPGH